MTQDTGLNVFFMGTLTIIGPDKLFRTLSGWADDLRDARLGWLVLLGAIVVTSIPPLMGYSTCITLCGFAFGWLSGWIIACAGAMLGAASAFTLARRTLQRYAPFLDQEPAFRGLASAVRLKGLPLIILIRLCPIPFGYSNAFFASIETVSLGQFLLATLVILPKLLIYVWIGERIYLLADPESRSAMDPTTKMLNMLSIAFGSGVGMFTGWYVWRLVKQEMEQSVALDDLEDESHYLERGEIDDDADDDVDAIERRLLAEGHLSRDQINGRHSTEQWGDNFSDFDADEGHPARDLGPMPQISIIAPTPVAEEPDPLLTPKLS